MAMATKKRARSQPHRDQLERRGIASQLANAAPTAADSDAPAGSSSALWRGLIAFDMRYERRPISRRGAHRPRRNREVYRIHDQLMDDRAALKTLRSDLSDTPDVVRAGRNGWF